LPVGNVHASLTEEVVNGSLSNVDPAALAGVALMARRPPVDASSSARMTAVRTLAHDLAE
jgi:hypothetical protein